MTRIVPFNQLKFVQGIADSICRDYSFYNDVSESNGVITVEFKSEDTDIEYIYCALAKELSPTGDCYVIVKRDIVLGLHKHILNYFKR